MLFLKAWIGGNIIISVFELLLSYLEFEEFGYNQPVWFLMLLYEHLEEELNKAGLWIFITTAGLFMLPTIIFLVIIVTAIKFLGLMWKGFKYVFRKKAEKR